MPAQIFHLKSNNTAVKQMVVKNKADVVKTANGMLKGVVFLVVYSEHCHACHDFMPIATEFIEKKAPDWMDSLLVEASNDGNVMKSCDCLKNINVPYYPFIGCIGKNGFVEFDGPRTPDTLMNFVMSQKGPNVKKTGVSAAKTKTIGTAKTKTIGATKSKTAK